MTELDVSRYPTLFPGQESLPGADGWHRLLERLFNDLEPMASAVEAGAPDKAPRVLQVKEKFGGLRVYLSKVGTPEMSARIDVAEEEASRTCYVCGEPGQMLDFNGFYNVRCPLHPHRGIKGRVPEFEPTLRMEVKVGDEGVVSAKVKKSPGFPPSEPTGWDE